VTKGNAMFKELDTVVLTLDLPQHGLRQGDVGAIVHAAANPPGYLVEFVAYDGHTVALVNVDPGALRLPGGNEIPHVRSTVAA